MGRTWHPEHFVCTHCQEEIGSRNFFERDGQPYCEQDYHNLFSPRCYYCNGPILDVRACHSACPVTCCVLQRGPSGSNVCVCVFRKWWRRWIGRGILSTSSVLSVDLFLDQKVTMSSHWQLLMCVNIPDVVKSSGRKLEWMNYMAWSNNAGLQFSSVNEFTHKYMFLLPARKHFICSSFMWIEGFCLWSCEGFHEKDGKAYCRKDYFDMFAPKCGGCARAILENYISALSSLWHPECFVCRVSNSDFRAAVGGGMDPCGPVRRGVRFEVTEVTSCLWSAGVLHPVCERQFLRTRRPAVLWDSLPRAPRLALLRLPEAHHWPLHHRHGQEVSPGALCVRLLPEAAQQRNVQRAERKAVLSRLLHQALQLERTRRRVGGGAWSNQVGAAESSHSENTEASVRERNVLLLIKFAFAVSALSGEMLVNTVDVQERRVWCGRSLVERVLSRNH